MLSREEVIKIAKLARLDLTEKELEWYREKLGRVLEYINELNKLPTEGTQFVRHVPRDAVAYREDVAIPFTDTKALLANAPALEDSQFLLPTIVERSE